MPEADLILAVDDTPKNLQLLGTILHNAGYEVAAARSGAQALSILEHTKPGLILLDVMMPEMDGFSTIAQIKANPATADIPVIFITARVDASDITEGFAAGAVDYIAKPFNTAELLARVCVHLSHKKNTDRLTELNKKLRAQARELERLNHDKNEMLGIVAHDLKNPLANILSSAEVLADPSRITATEPLVKLAARITGTAEGMLKLIDNLLNINAIEEGVWEEGVKLINVYGLLRQVAGEYAAQALRKRLTFNCTFDSEAELHFRTDPDALHRILDNLISNAVKYSEPGGLITLCAELYHNRLHISVADQGPGLTEADMEQLFGKYKRLSAKPTGGESSTGLGLAIAKKLCEKLSGSIFAESEHGKGAVFTVSLPHSELPTGESDNI